MNKNILFRLFKENFKTHWGLYSAAVISMLLTAVTTSASAWIMKDIINTMSANVAVNKILTISFLTAFIFIVKGMSVFSQSYFLNKAGNSIIAEQQLRLYQHVMNQSISFHNGTTSSDLLVRVTQGAQSARSVIDSMMTTFVRDFFSVIGLLGVMLFQNLWLTIGALLVGPFAFFSVKILLNRIRVIAAKEMLSLGEIMRIVQETSIGIRIIKTFLLEKTMLERMEKAVYDVRNRANSIGTLQAISSPIMETLAGITIACLIGFSGYFIASNNSTIGSLMSFITALLLAYEPVKRLVNVRIQLETGIVGARMLFDLLDQPVTLSESPNACPLPQNNNQSIIFENVSFFYTQENPVLKNINLEIKKGEKFALVGPSGSGKSTLISLIMRLYDPQEGSIKINGMDIRQASFDSLRKEISYVGQDSFLFNGSIAYNIGLGRKEATFDEIILAAKLANAHSFIMECPNGYDTPVGDNGSCLSGGQKQRISIARAILRNSPILILDEATSALDAQTEQIVKDALEHLMLGKTCIMIAHRFSTIKKADHIIVLDNGRIFEEGSHESLLKNNMLFKKLYKLQFH